jgi:hypothetical protein
MISKGAAIAFLGVALVMANVMVFKAFSRGSEHREDEHVYQYSKMFGKFFCL